MRVATPAPCPPTPGRLIADADDEGGRAGRDEDADGVVVLGVGCVEAAIGGGDDTVDRGSGGLVAVDVGVGACIAGSTMLLLVVDDESDDGDGDDPFMPPLASPAPTAAAPKSFALIPAAVHAFGRALPEVGKEDGANAASSIVVVVALAPGRTSPALETYSAFSGTADDGPGLLLVEEIPNELSIPSCNCSCC
jgi:hypothetical protein